MTGTNVFNILYNNEIYSLENHYGEGDQLLITNDTRVTRIYQDGNLISYTDVVNGFAVDTTILMADEWQEILEYAAALRLAPQVNLSDKRVELREALYGDTKFQTTSGIEGAPGLVNDILVNETP